ncbi:porin family protein [Fulvivirga maritima]|uniref:outer membrane beta-barrel protein n=1 Tax=Fulvivirga maritima TaxID=2904247 RepID=UPI001F1D7B9B|nr:outer membrane beta-barrel protein [Fulvivirga maritima]UII28951.1 porin family protein [Fulvivirga maritima]
MNKLLLSLALITCSCIAAKAQNYKPFKLGLGLGYATPDGGPGILFDVEPAYRLNDNIAIGFRWESTAMSRTFDDSDNELYGRSSYTLNGQYYLSDSKIRPYIGLGLGIYKATSIGFLDFTDNSLKVSDDTESKFGFYPRIGLDIAHFNINIDYNISSKTESKTIVKPNGETEKTPEIKNNYIGIRIGAFLFGGER